MISKSVSRCANTDSRVSLNSATRLNVGITTENNDTSRTVCVQTDFSKEFVKSVFPRMIAQSTPISGLSQSFGRLRICKIETRFVYKLRLVAVGIDLMADGVEFCYLVVVPCQVTCPA